MAETDFIPIKAARFRTSRYPGFVGGSIDPVTGNLRPGFPTLTPNAGETTDPTAEEEKPTNKWRISLIYSQGRARMSSLPPGNQPHLPPKCSWAYAKPSS